MSASPVGWLAVWHYLSQGNNFLTLKMRFRRSQFHFYVVLTGLFRDIFIGVWDGGNCTFIAKVSTKLLLSVSRLVELPLGTKFSSDIWWPPISNNLRAYPWENCRKFWEYLQKSVLIKGRATFPLQIPNRKSSNEDPCYYSQFQNQTDAASRVKIVTVRLGFWSQPVM